MRIAIFMDPEGNTQTFDRSGMVKIYQENENSGWTCTDQVPFYINTDMILSDIRKSINTLIPHLIHCKILIAQRSIGIFQTIFEEELHLRLFLVHGHAVPYLSVIKEQYKAQIRDSILKIESKKKDAEDIYPILNEEHGKLCYRINLVKVQEKNSSMSSKEILLPFFQKEQFTELEVICLHIPKWIERELVNFNMAVRTETRKDGLCHVFVYSQT